MHFKIDQSHIGVFAALQQDTAGAITEQDTGRTILKIEYRAHLVGANDHHFAMRAAFDELGAGRKCVSKTRTGGRQVISPGSAGPNLVLHQAGRGWKNHVRSDRCNDDKIDFVGIYLPALD